jgi:hypothetical protein
VCKLEPDTKAGTEWFAVTNKQLVRRTKPKTNPKSSQRNVENEGEPMSELGAKTLEEFIAS